MGTENEGRDFRAEIMARRMAKNPEFPSLVAQARARRIAAEESAARRERLDLNEADTHIKAARVLPRAKKLTKYMPGRAARRANA